MLVNKFYTYTKQLVPYYIIEYRLLLGIEEPRFSQFSQLNWCLLYSGKTPATLFQYLHVYSAFNKDTKCESQLLDLVK